MYVIINIEVNVMEVFNKSVENSAVSVTMEGFAITNQDKELCQKLIDNEITMAQYIAIVLKQQGVTA